MTKNILKLFLLLFIFFSFVFILPVFAENNDIDNKEEKVIIYFFDDRLCPVCRETKNFIEEIKSDYSQLELFIYPISDTEKLKEIAENFGIENLRIMAPSIFINDNFLQFNQFTSIEKNMVIQAIEGEVIEKDCCKVKIPFLNIEIDISNWSLPLTAMVLGLIDGLNVCSLGALILVLSIVIVFESKKKIFFYGGIFIFTTVIIYGTLVFVWGKLFELLVGQIEILRMIVGLASLIGGIYFFKEFYKFFKHGPSCESSGSKIIQGATSKLKKSFEEPGKKIYLLVGSIMLFAAIITIVELPCSVGVPIIFTGILIESQVSSTSYFFYILFYLLFYMLDEVVIFIGAVLTKRIWFAGSKLITWITFIGSIVLFYFAFYYLIGF